MGLEQHLSDLSIGKRTSDENSFQPLEDEQPRKRQKMVHPSEGDRYVESTSRSARKQRQELRLRVMRREHSLRAPTYRLLEAHGNSINSSRSAVRSPPLFFIFIHNISRLDNNKHNSHE